MTSEHNTRGLPLKSRHDNEQTIDTYWIVAMQMTVFSGASCELDLKFAVDSILLLLTTFR